MKIWILDFEEDSGAFSSKKKALECWKKGAERLEYTNIKIEDHGGWISLSAYFDKYPIKAVIYHYILNEDNFNP